MHLAELLVVAVSAVNKNLFKVKYCRKGHLPGIAMSILTGFCLLVDVYFNDLQINRWLHLKSCFMETIALTELH